MMTTTEKTFFATRVIYLPSMPPPAHRKYSLRPGMEGSWDRGGFFNHCKRVRLYQRGRSPLDVAVVVWNDLVSVAWGGRWIGRAVGLGWGPTVSSQSRLLHQHPRERGGRSSSVAQGESRGNVGKRYPPHTKEDKI